MPYRTSGQFGSQVSPECPPAMMFGATGAADREISRSPSCANARPWNAACDPTESTKPVHNWAKVKKPVPTVTAFGFAALGAAVLSLAAFGVGVFEFSAFGVTFVGVTVFGVTLVF